MSRIFLLVTCAAMWTVAIVTPLGNQAPVAANLNSPRQLSMDVPCPGDVSDPAIPYHTVRLPNGSVLCSGTAGPVALGKHTRVELTTVGVRQDYAPQVEFVVGNHAEVLQKERVGTPAGEATLALVRRTPPAAAGDQRPSYEYWLVVWRSHPLRTDMALAHAIRAFIFQASEKARQEVLDLAKTWHIEGE